MEDNYLIAREYDARIADSISSVHANFIEFKHSNGLYYFAFIQDGKVALRSEGYQSEASRDQGIHSVIKNYSDRNNYRTESAHGAHFLILLAGNNKEIARSYPMREEVETYLALNNLTSHQTATHSIIEEDKNIIEDKEPKVLAVEESKEVSEESMEKNVESENLRMQVEEKTLDEPEKADETAKIISSPLLESFQKEIVNSEVKENIDKKEVHIELDNFELEDDQYVENQTNITNEAENVQELEVTIEDKPTNSFIEKINLADEIYHDDHSKPQSQLGKILAEEEQTNKKGSKKWIIWLFLILLLGAIAWWLFQMKGCETVEKIVNKDNTLDSASRVEQNKQVDSNKGIDSASLQAKATWEKTLGGMVAIRLPDGSVLNVPENGTEKRLVEYLEAKCGTSEIKKTWFDMDRILFKSGTDELKEISDEQITLLAKIFKSYPKKKFKIGGYTDNVGDPEVNIRLSAIRAAAAARAIASKGIDSTRMRYEGYGQEHPICPANDTEECRAKNRRVAIRVDVCE